MLKVKLYFFSSFFLVEVVRFFVTYGLARNKTGSVKDGITELYQKKKISHTKWIIEKKKNVSRTCSFKFWRAYLINKSKILARPPISYFCICEI